MTNQPKSILITGVAGFIGRYVARYFSDHHWCVIGVDNSTIENAPLGNLSSYYSLKLPDKQFNELLKKHCPQVCIHCAGRASVGGSISEPASDFYTNTVLTFEVLNALRLNCPKCQFIFLSSAAVYGNPNTLPVTETHPAVPLSPYGFHKLQSEELCLEFSKTYNLPTASMRIFSAYGQGLRRQVLWDICQKAITQKSVNLQGTGKESRDFIHAHDIARALMVIVNSAPMQGEVYNLASGHEVTIRDLANLILEALDCSLIPRFNGIVPPGIPLNWQADISKLNTLGFKISIPLRQGIKSFARWCHAELTM